MKRGKVRKGRQDDLQHKAGQTSHNDTGQDQCRSVDPGMTAQGQVYPCQLAHIMKNRSQYAQHQIRDPLFQKTGEDQHDCNGT